MSNGQRLLANDRWSTATDERGECDDLGLEHGRYRHGLAHPRPMAISGAERAASARTPSHARAKGPAKSCRIVQKWATTTIGCHSTSRRSTDSAKVGRRPRVDGRVSVAVSDWSASNEGDL